MTWLRRLTPTICAFHLGFSLVREPERDTVPRMATRRPQHHPVRQRRPLRVRGPVVLQAPGCESDHPLGSRIPGPALVRQQDQSPVHHPPLHRPDDPQHHLPDRRLGRTGHPLGLPTGLTPEQETPHPKCEPQTPLTAPPKPAENPDAARGLEHVPSRASITPSDNKRAPAPSLSVAVAQRHGRLPHRTLGEASIAATAAPTIDV